LTAAADTSVIIAALLSWHERHDSARTALDRMLEENGLVLPAPVLLEAYSVMTRLPAPHRLSPSDAFELLRSTFGSVSIVTLDEDEIWPLLERTATDGVAGGRTYDAHIMACARKAKAGRLLTLNPRDFDPLEVREIEVATA
jgi:predicted nucleic acid-binding protein